MPPDGMEKSMAEEKIEIEQIEEFAEELSDEVLDQEGARNYLVSLCATGSRP